MPTEVTVKDYIDDYPFGSWNAMELDMKVLSRCVKAIHFCAAENHDNSGEDGRPPANAWLIFLELSDKQSVRLLMTSGESSRTGGMIEAWSKPYAYTAQNVCRVSAKVKNGRTVEDVFRLIIERRRDKYRFADNHEGGQYWVQVVVQDLVDADFVERDVLDRVQGVIVYYWYYPQGSGYTYRAIERGEFF